MISKTFFDYFQDYTNSYVIIGGNAASILLHDDGQQFRATQDYDVVVIFENAGGDFAAKFLTFVKKYEYTALNSGLSEDGQKNYYRFQRYEKSGEVPVQIELFSRKPLAYILKSNNFKTPLHYDDGPSLSAIILNDDYYELLKIGSQKMGNQSLLGPSALIYFKAKAHLDVRKRINAGQKVTHRMDKTKHFKDVCRLCSLLPEADFDTSQVPLACQQDLKAFIMLVQDEDPKLFKGRFRSDVDFEMTQSEVITVLKTLIPK